MKFQLYSATKQNHTGFVSCVCWLNNELVVTCGDDRKLLIWNASAHPEPIRTIQLPIESYPTSIDSMSTVNTNVSSSIDSSSSSFSNFKSDPQSNQLIALGVSNGQFYLFSPNWNGNRMEKAFDAHADAIIVIRWSNDNTTLATGGEDGLIKIWSRSGMLRSTITVGTLPIYALAWSPDSNSLVYGNGNQMIVKSLSPQSKSIEWIAHDGLIVNLHWSPLNGHILSASEDFRVKMWDGTGRLLFVSVANTTAPSSVSWSADGDCFAISTFNTIKLHDSSGACLFVEKLASEGIHSVAWSPDSNQLCCVCASGQVIFSYVVEKTFESGVWRVMNTSRRSIKVTNCTNDFAEVLDFRDSINRISFAYERLVIVTTSQCFIYQSNNWTTPHQFELKNIDVWLIKQSQKHFLLMNTTNANLYSYDGRFIRMFKLSNMRLECIRSNLVSLNNKTLAYKDGINAQTIHFIDLDSSKSATQRDKNVISYRHVLPVLALKMSTDEKSKDQICAFMDKNSDLYILSINGHQRTNLKAFKLSSMIFDFIWHSEANVLVSLHDNHNVTLWLYPNVVFTDSSLIAEVLLNISSDQLTTSNSRIEDFSQSQLTIKRADNVRIHIPVNPFVVLLHNLKSDGRWQEAVKMCNFLDKTISEVDSIDRNVCKALWATLAAMTLDAKEFATAEVAYAAINKLDKVLYLNRIKSLTIPEVVSIELELVSGNVMEAEHYFIQKGYILRAVMLNLELFQWKRAMELAEKYNAKFGGINIESERHNTNSNDLIEENDLPRDNNISLIHLVLACRQNYLKNKRKSENLKEFQALLNEIDHVIEWSDVEKVLKHNDQLIYSKSL